MFRDLSRPVDTDMPTYPGDPDVTLTTDATHDADGYATSEIRMGSHAGTHVDAPRHTIPDGAAIDDRDVGSFALDARLVDLRPLESREPITPVMLSATVERDGTEDRPAPDCFVLRTGWAAHWGTDRYRDHPFLTEAAAEWCRERGAGVGLDTFGPDPTPAAEDASTWEESSTADGSPTGEESSTGTDPSTGASRPTDEPEGTPAHDVLLGAGLPIVENLRGLDGLPERFRLYAFPLRLRGGDGSPVRAVAEWEE